LVDVAVVEQTTIAETDAAETVRSHRLRAPTLGRAVRLLDVEPEPGVRVLPVDLDQRPGDDHRLRHVELRVHRVVRVSRRDVAERQADTGQRRNSRSLTHRSLFLGAVTPVARHAVASARPAKAPPTNPAFDWDICEIRALGSMRPSGTEF